MTFRKILASKSIYRVHLEVLNSAEKTYCVSFSFRVFFLGQGYVRHVCIFLLGLTMPPSIAVDFFRSAFDGSGADNFFDAGSCIDGRLTSAWNCKQKNDSYKVLYMSGIDINLKYRVLSD
jgi:hypothetical protein